MKRNKGILIKILFTLTFTVICSLGFAQRHHKKGCISGVIRDSLSGEAVEMAAVGVPQCNKWCATDSKGRYRINCICLGKHSIVVKCLGYKMYTKEIDAQTDTTNFDILLIKEDITLDEVIVTAQESKSSVTSSVIKKDAIKHLQPSCFAELMALLPGGLTADPTLNGVNIISLRQTGADANTSLGTSFYIDGARMSNNAAMANSALWESMVDSRSSAFMGIDLRTIPTDEIEKVEIIRGIPSVRYGDITSGVVMIERKTGESPLSARIKSDPSSKLFHISKGFNLRNQYSRLSLGGDLLINNQDPSNILESYKRLNASVRYEKIFSPGNNPLSLSLSGDYTGSFDNEKKDKDIDIASDDYYKQSYNNLMLKVKTEWNRNDSEFFRYLYFSASLNYAKDELIRNRLTSNEREIPYIAVREEGVHDGEFIPNQYQSYLKVDGKPVNFNTSLYGNFHLNFWNTRNIITVGSDFSYDKNNGRGELFEPMRPPYGAGTRPRAYKDIPSQQRLAFFAEENFSVNISDNKLDVVAGIRATTIPNLNKGYALADKFHCEPRMNAQWSFPKLTVLGDSLRIALSAGFGKHLKFPTLNYLYPEQRYFDIMQLNYYHSNKDYRRVNYKTYIVDRVNYDICYADNIKKEIGLDISWGKNSFFITLFKEKMSSGFRNIHDYKSMTYKKYDNNSVDYSKLTAPPRLEDMTYQLDTTNRIYGKYGNGALLVKKGVEYNFSFARINSIKTKFDINGAYFKTTYSNSLPVLKKKQAIINGKALEYIGEYMYDGGHTKERFNTNFRFDTDVPEWGLIFSGNFECIWFESRQTNRTVNRPTEYIDKAGVRHAYTDESAKDARLQWLVLNFNDLTFKKERKPIAAFLNLKVTKKFSENIRLAMFVNRILNYLPSYEVGNVKVKRRTFPYFGMELNISI